MKSPAQISDEPKRKVLTCADIEAINEDKHSCGHRFNPNPDCGCMCGTTYMKADGAPILSRYGRFGPACTCSFGKIQSARSRLEPQINDEQALDILHHASVYLSNHWRDSFTRAEAQSSLNARVILFNCSNLIFIEHGVGISREEIEGPAILERSRLEPVEVPKSDGFIECPQCGRAYLPGTWGQNGGKCPNCNDLFRKCEPVEAVSTTPKECKYGDKTCPCQDGDPCHYEGENPMKPKVSTPLPQQVDCSKAWWPSNAVCGGKDCVYCYPSMAALPQQEEPADNFTEAARFAGITPSQGMQFHMFLLYLLGKGPAPGFLPAEPIAPLLEQESPRLDKSIIPDIAPEFSGKWRDAVDSRRIALRDQGGVDDETAIFIAPAIEGALALTSLAAANTRIKDLEEDLFTQGTAFAETLVTESNLESKLSEAQQTIEELRGGDKNK